MGSGASVHEKVSDVPESIRSEMTEILESLENVESERALKEAADKCSELLDGASVEVYRYFLGKQEMGEFMVETLTGLASAIESGEEFNEEQEELAESIIKLFVALFSAIDDFKKLTTLLPDYEKYATNVILGNENFLMSIVKLYFSPKMEKMVSIMGNLCLFEEVVNTLFSFEYDFANRLDKYIEDEPKAAEGNAMVIFFALQKCDDDCAMKIFKAERVASTFKDGDEEMRLMFLAYASRHRNVAELLNAEESGAVESLIGELEDEDSAKEKRVFCAITVANLLGKSERANKYSEVLGKAIEELLTVLKSAVSGDVDSCSGVSISLSLSALSVLVVNDSNKKILDKREFKEILAKVLKMYVDKHDGFPLLGGGASDRLSAALAIDILLQLSLLHEDNEELQSKYITKDLGVFASLETLLANGNAQGEKLDKDARQNASLLRGRLLPVTKAPVSKPSPSKTGGGSKSHIMLSYCWNKSAKPENVKALGAKLRELGYDIWRDEEGSSLVPPMGGNIEDRMAEAIEAASFVVICVSKDYKERPNCRMEAKYANQLFHRDKLKLVYCMMEEEYTTVSKPETVDGWLGIMVSDSLWHALWSAKFVDKCAAELADIFGNNGKMSSAEAKASAAASSGGGAKDLQAAYSIISSGTAAADEGKLKAFLDDLGGVSSADDLDLLEPSDIEKLASLLKKLLAKKFLKAMGVSQ